MTLVERLRKRQKRVLPSRWQEGRECPECGVGADRPKCFFDMGGSCPRHHPDQYEPSPYVMVTDADCAEAADEIDRLTAELEQVKATYENLEASEILNGYKTRADRLTAENERLREALSPITVSGLNVADAELLRIRNNAAENAGGNVRISGKMLMILVDAIRSSRAALEQP